VSKSSIGRNSRSRGHAFERIVAELFEGYRTGSDQGGKHGDVQTTTAVIECKSHTGPVPKWIADAMTQAIEAGEATGKEPTTVHGWARPGHPREVYEIRRIA
jgi:hypothetical protein